MYAIVDVGTTNNDGKKTIHGYPDYAPTKNDDVTIDCVAVGNHDSHDDDVDDYFVSYHGNRKNDYRTMRNGNVSIPKIRETVIDWTGMNGDDDETWRNVAGVPGTNENDGMNDDHGIYGRFAVRLHDYVVLLPLPLLYVPDEDNEDDHPFLRRYYRHQ